MRPLLDHFDEDAELYALGLLADDDRERVDAHAGVCIPCAQRLGRAEIAVGAMVDATHPLERAPRAMIGRFNAAARARGASATKPQATRWSTPWALAAAALFALVAGGLGVQNAALQSHIVSDGDVFVAMIHSHFNHTQFMTLDGTPVEAKVVYDRSGGWYEILATRIDPNTRVAIVRAGVARVSGERFEQRGGALRLTLPGLGSVDELRLIDAQGRVLAVARPVLTTPTTPSR